MVIKFLIVAWVILIPAVIYGQDPITDSYPNSFTGIYNIYSSGFEELFIYSDNTFKYVGKSINRCRPFGGTWYRMNDSTVHFQPDTRIYITASDKYVDEFYCIKPIIPGIPQELLCIFPVRRDSFNGDLDPQKFLMQKNGILYENGSLKCDRKLLRFGKIITSYHPNGKVAEIIEYNSDDARDGAYLKYDERGRLRVYQRWRKGKLRREDEYDHWWW